MQQSGGLLLAADLRGGNTIRGAAEAIESGERGERCRRQIKRPERVAAVGVQRSRSVGKAHTGYRNRTPAPKQYNPNQLFRVGNGFGLFVYFTRYEYTYFGNGWQIRPESKPRGPRKKKTK